MLGWVTRCLPGFSIIGLSLMLLAAFSDILHSTWKSIFPPSSTPSPPAQDGWWSGLNLPQQIFVVYAVLIHFHMFGFTMRLGWSIFRATGKARNALNRRLSPSPTPVASPKSQPGDDLGLPSPVSISSVDPILPKADVTVTEIDEQELVHAIILPNYCEDLYTLETTLKVLASHPRARTQYEVRLFLSG